MSIIQIRAPINYQNNSQHRQIFNEFQYAFLMKTICCLSDNQEILFGFVQIVEKTYASNDQMEKCEI